MLFLIFMLLAFVFLPPLFWGIVIAGTCFGILGGVVAVCGAIGDWFDGVGAK